jgi:hypothetical protein
VTGSFHIAVSKSEIHVFFIENDKGPKYPNAWDRCWSGFCSQAEISCQEIPGCKPPAFLILSYDKVCAMPVGRFKDSSSTTQTPTNRDRVCLCASSDMPPPRYPLDPGDPGWPVMFIELVATISGEAYCGVSPLGSLSAETRMPRHTWCNQKMQVMTVES